MAQHPCPEEFVSLAHRLADAAGDVIRPLFRRKLDVVSKADHSPVTIADRNAEQAMRDLIEAAYPDHGIIGEEHGQVRADADYVWILDPIDGTQSFISGAPTFTCLIGLAYKGTPVMGVVDQPVSRERWTGANGNADLNGASVTVRDPGVDLADASLFSWGAETFDSSRGNDFRRLTKATRRCRFGYDGYAYGLLASGFVDMVADFDMKPYDYCAVIPLIENAGGVVSDWDGNALSLNTPGYVLASASKKLHQDALAILAG
jgi:inositol-phosphate phosphatase/L-galactose 1-phosphate phosphatase/histidinol-phosphatase